MGQQCLRFLDVDDTGNHQVIDQKDRVSAQALPSLMTVSHSSHLIGLCFMAMKLSEGLEFNVSLVSHPHTCPNVAVPK